MNKLGCVSPSLVNLPWDITDVVPPAASVAVVTLNVRNGLPGEADRALASFARAVDVLVDEGAGAVVAFGAPISAKRGYAAEDAALRALTAARGNVPITSSLAASARGFRHLDVRRPLLVTQYRDDVNAQLVAFFRELGLEPAGAVGLHAGNAAEVNALAAGDFAALTQRSLAQYAHADGVFLSARGNLRATARALEIAIGLPVIEQVTAAVWWALCEFGIPTAADGRLLVTAPAATHGVA